MGVRGNIGIQRTNYNMKSKRRKLYDKDVQKLRSGYRQFEDHTRMKSHEFADFQKKLYKENASNRKHFLQVFSISMFIVIVILLYFLFFYQMDPIKPLKWPE